MAPNACICQRLREHLRYMCKKQVISPPTLRTTATAADSAGPLVLGIHGFHRRTSQVGGLQRSPSLCRQVDKDGPLLPDNDGNNCRRDGKTLPHVRIQESWP